MTALIHMHFLDSSSPHTYCYIHNHLPRLRHTPYTRNSHHNIGHSLANKKMSSQTSILNSVQFASWHVPPFGSLRFDRQSNRATLTEFETFVGGLTHYDDCMFRAKTTRLGKLRNRQPIRPSIGNSRHFFRGSQFISMSLVINSKRLRQK